MKKLNIQFMALLSGVAMLLLTACGPKGNNPELESLADMLNTTVSEAMTGNDMGTGEAACVDNVVKVKVVFAKPSIYLADLSPEVVNYFMAVLLRENPGKKLDQLINTLSKTHSKLELSVYTSEGAVCNTEYTAQRLVQLMKTPLSKLDFNQVKAHILSALQTQCDALAAQFKADSCAFDMEKSYGTYIFYFPKINDFAGLSQGNVKARHLGGAKAGLDYFGTYKAEVEEVMKSVGISGYRYVYRTAAPNSPEMRASLSWSEL